MTGADGFKRIVLGVSHRPFDDVAARVALALAEDMRLDLLGYYPEDADVLALGAMPFARELRLLERGWTEIDATRLAAEAALMAQRAERRFLEAVTASGATPSFRVFQGSQAEAIRSLSRAGDIVVISESSGPDPFATYTTQQLADVALGSEASVLLVPGRIARQRGSVVALTARTNDASVEAAAFIADATKSKLVIACIGETRDDLQLLEAVRLASLNERLLVTARGLLESSAASMLATRRRVPVLIAAEAPLSAIETNS